MLSSIKTIGRSTIATAAIEFALIAPLFLLLIFGTIAFGAVISTYNAIQQLAAEAARASLAGTTDSERDQLARSFVVGALASYPFIVPSNLTVATASDLSPRDFRVTLSYDMSRLFVFNLGGLVPLPAPVVTRSSVVLVTL